MRIIITQDPPPIPGGIATQLVAQPGGQAGALPLPARLNVVTTIPAGGSVVLQILGGHQQQVFARGGVVLPVYPTAGTAIEGYAVNVPVTIADRNAATFTWDGVSTWLIS